MPGCAELDIACKDAILRPFLRRALHRADVRFYVKCKRADGTGIAVVGCGKNTMLAMFWFPFEVVGREERGPMAAQIR